MNRNEAYLELRKLLVAHQEGNTTWRWRHRECDYCDGRMRKVMKIVDAYAASLSSKPKPEPELWTCDEAAVHLGLSSGAAARSVMSRAGIKATGKTRRVPGSQRLRVLYPAQEIREKLIGVSYSIGPDGRSVVSVYRKPDGIITFRTEVEVLRALLGDKLHSQEDGCV